MPQQIEFFLLPKCKYLAFEAAKFKSRAVDIYLPDMGNLLIYISNMNVGP